MESAVEHRKHKRKSSKKLSMEMILRRSFCESINEYVKNCSLAGARHLSDPNLNPFQRVVRGLIFFAALATSCYFFLYLWSDTLTKPLIVTMDSSTYPIGSINFPAVAICNINRISKKALIRFAVEEYADLAANGESLEEVQQMLLNWGRLINYSYNESLRNNPIFLRMIEKYRFDNQRISQIMKMLAPTCEDMVLRCSWRGSLVNCADIFSMHRIANRGHCCTFNYWVRKRHTNVQRQSEPGHLYGLNVILDPQLDDYAFPLNAIQGFDVLILDPSHFADPSAGRVIHRICEPNMVVYLELKATKQIATNEVKKYSVKTRKCLFHDEDTTQTFDVYSYSSCIILCRINTIYSLCKCTPFFLATKELQRGPMCTFENLRCLNKYREKLYYLYPMNAESTKGLEVEVQDSLYCSDCLPDCELTTYVTKTYEIPITSTYSEEKNMENFFASNLDMTNKSYLTIFHPLPDANLDRLDVVYYWYEILSNAGGFCGVIIGFSIISIVELLYFISVRFLRHIYVNYHKYK